MSLVVSTPPTEWPVTLQEAKGHLRVTGDDDNNYVTALIKAATAYAEEFTRRKFIDTSLTMTTDAWPDPWELPFSPLDSVTSVKYYDVDDAQQTWTSTNYQVDSLGEPGTVTIDPDSTYPTLSDLINAVETIYKVGYGAAADVPEGIKQAILLLVGHWYENREAYTEAKLTKVPLAVEALLWQYRVPEIA